MTDASPTTALEKIAARYFDTFFQHIPAIATQLGVHKYDHLLGDFSNAGMARLGVVTHAALDELATIDPTTLSVRENTEYKLLVNLMESNLMEVEEIRGWQRDPIGYVEIITVSTFLLLVRDFAPLADRLRSAASRMQALPDFLATARAQISNPSRISVETAIEMTQGAVGIFSQLAPMLAQQLEDTAQRDEMLAVAQQATTATEDFATWMQNELLPQANGDYRMGADLYTRKVLQHDYMLDFTPEQVLARGQKTFDASLREMEELARTIDPNKDWQQIVEEAKDEHPTADNLLAVYAEESARLRQFLIDHNVLTLPKGEHMGVEETPLFLRPLVPYAAYSQPGPYEQSKEGQFWVSVPNPNSSAEAKEAQLREHSYYFVPDLTAHEGYPGHHVQLTAANQYGSYIRNHAGNSTIFAEGWGLYSEQLMDELGYYKDPRTKLFQLKEQLKRAARIIIDISIHCGTMTPEQAIRLMVEKVKLSEEGATGEVKMHCAAPGQKISYQLGKELILDLREEAAARWGDQFTLQRFHDRLLASGTIPPKLIREEFFATQD